MAVEVGQLNSVISTCHACVDMNAEDQDRKNALELAYDKLEEVPENDVQGNDDMAEKYLQIIDYLKRFQDSVNPRSFLFPI